MGIDWWQHDPALSSAAHGAALNRDQLAQRLDRLETMLASLIQEREKQLPSTDAVTTDDASEHAP